jgi:hypothetical protein
MMQWLAESYVRRVVVSMKFLLLGGFGCENFGFFISKKMQISCELASFQNPIVTQSTPEPNT